MNAECTLIYYSLAICVVFGVVGSTVALVKLKSLHRSGRRNLKNKKFGYHIFFVSFDILHGNDYILVYIVEGGILTKYSEYS